MKKKVSDLMKVGAVICGIICVFSLLVALYYSMPHGPLLSSFTLGPIKMESTSPEFDKALIALMVALVSGFLSLGFWKGSFPKK
jgi:hypothetical protein